jgi:RNA polymerase sigma factor (sigma-70 family)
MGDGRSHAMIEPLRTLFGAGTAAGLTDGDLLEQFATRRSEAAFAALVQRHGTTVRRVCRALLDDPHDVDDAFQATFLVLARKASSVRRPEPLGNWLYGVAHRASRKLRRQAARRRGHEAREASMARPQGASGEAVAVRREEAAIVHEEVGRLPERYRAAIVLCDLEGLSHEEVARRHRFSDRTLRRRLVRARSLLRARLVRRGLAPSAGLLASALGPEPASASSAVPEAMTDALARAASRFAAGEATAGIVPASAKTLAEGVITAMSATSTVGIAIVSGVVLALGAGVGVGFAVMGDEPRAAAPKAEVRGPTPAEQLKALVERYGAARKASTEAAQKVQTEAEQTAIFEKLLPRAGDYAPQALALAEGNPGDPVAVDALLWVLELGLANVEGAGAFAEATGRAMTILVRDHAGEPRLGPACLQLVRYPSPRRDVFLRAVAERSPDRVVRGRATMALGSYLKSKAEFVAALRAGAPMAKDEILVMMYGPEYLAALRSADPAPILADSAAAMARVLTDYADVPAVSADGRPTRETLADVARREAKKPPAEAEKPPLEDLSGQFRAIDEALGAGLRAASKAEEDARKQSDPPAPADASVRAWLAAYPRWAETGAKMWRLAEENPRNPVAFDALIWLVAQDHGFFEAPAERAEVMKQVADGLIRDHLDELSAHLTDRNVAMALNNGEAFPAPHRERIHRALFERARDRATRGRAGLSLARYLKSSADFLESLALRGSDPSRRVEVTKFTPAYLAELRKTDYQALRTEAGRVLDRVIAEYGDVPSANGSLVTKEPLAEVAARELTEIRSLAIGMTAPEIVGEDVEGRPMKLSDYRGKVVLLDFGSHEHCGGCRLVYPRLRAIVGRLRGRPFAVLGINDNDRRDTLKGAMAGGEITWPCWWDGDKADGPGPIASAWNIRGYPTFILLDHRGVIRSKGDVHPSDVRTFDEAVDRLLKDAEADSPRR